MPVVVLNVVFPGSEQADDNTSSSVLDDAPKGKAVASGDDNQPVEDKSEAAAGVQGKNGDRSFSSTTLIIVAVIIIIILLIIILFVVFRRRQQRQEPQPATGAGENGKLKGDKKGPKVVESPVMKQEPAWSDEK
uniref:Uncharacterized protein n=1 Tax=Romanomermis culicivorax TaxID=13658 RepID=A0A915LER1_ROMCU